MSQIRWLVSVNESLIQWVDKKKEFFPFSNIILWYLKLKLSSKILIFILVSFSSSMLFYHSGVVILQSKARNEVLSFASAYHSSIPFPSVLYLLYALIYFTTIILTIAAVVAPCGWLYFFYKKNFSQQDNNRLGKSIIILTLLFITSIVVIYSFLFVPAIPYYLLYVSNDSEVISNLFVNQINSELHSSSETYSFKDLRNSVFISVQVWVLIILLCFFLVWIHHFFFSWLSKKLQGIQIPIDCGNLFNKIKNFIIQRGLDVIEFTRSFVIFLLSLMIIVIFIFQLAFLGKFGKALAEFETDYVKAKYVFNGEIYEDLEGYRIYQDKNHVIIRDKNHVIHYLNVNELHIQKTTSNH